MSNTTPAFGLTREIDAKYNLEEEKQAMAWIEEVLGRKFYDDQGKDKVHGLLKDGSILCELMNKLKPGSVKGAKSSKMAFVQMENISKFLDAAKNYGLKSHDMFQTIDLYEGKNMYQVIVTITALGRKAQVQGFDGPTLGPREASENKRNFTQEQLDECKSTVSGQYGYAGGANQSGVNFGKSRKIID